MGSSPLPCAGAKARAAAKARAFAPGQAKHVCDPSISHTHTHTHTHSRTHTHTHTHMHMHMHTHTRAPHTRTHILATVDQGAGQDCDPNVRFDVSARAFKDSGQGACPIRYWGLGVEMRKHFAARALRVHRTAHARTNRTRVFGPLSANGRAGAALRDALSRRSSRATQLLVYQRNPNPYPYSAFSVALVPSSARGRAGAALRDALHVRRAGGRRAAVAPRVGGRRPRRVGGRVPHGALPPPRARARRADRGVERRPVLDVERVRCRRRRWSRRRRRRDSRAGVRCWTNGLTAKSALIVTFLLNQSRFCSTLLVTTGKQAPDSERRPRGTARLSRVDAPNWITGNLDCRTTRAPSDSDARQSESSPSV